MIPTDTAPGRVALSHWLTAVAALITAASMVLLRDWSAALGFAAAGIASVSCVVACERWYAWQHIAEHGRPPDAGHWTCVDCGDNVPRRMVAQYLDDGRVRCVACA